MNSKPSFYPKHLARQYVQEWSQAEDNPSGIQVSPVAPASCKFNGQRSVTPVGMTSNSTESSPSSMSSGDCSRDDSRSNRKILEGLPDTFISAMRQLFCLLDIENSGQVHIEDIAENWSPDGAGAVLPPNIVPSLKKVTTPEGFLTFERFCAGLKIAILRHSAQRHRQIESSEDNSDNSEEVIGVASSISRTNSLPNLLDSTESEELQKTKNKIISPSPAPSEPSFKIKPDSQALTGPPKPPRDPNRLSNISQRNIAGSTTSLPAFLHSRSSTPKDTEFIWKAPPSHFATFSQSNLFDSRLSSQPTCPRPTDQGQDTIELRTLKNMETIKSCLQESIPLLEKTAMWCKTNLINLNNQLNHDIDLKEPQIDFNVNHFKDVNTRMKFLMQRPHEEPLKVEPTNVELLRRIDRLQEQNRLLTKEVSRQSNRVTALERDKRTLIKQLFQSSTNSLNSNASTLR